MIENTVPVPKFAIRHLPGTVMSTVDRIPASWVVSKTSAGAVEVFDPESSQTTYYYRKVAFSWCPRCRYFVPGHPTLQGIETRRGMIAAIKRCQEQAHA